MAEMKGGRREPIFQVWYGQAKASLAWRSNVSRDTSDDEDESLVSEEDEAFDIVSSESELLSSAFLR